MTLRLDIREFSMPGKWFYKRDGGEMLGPYTSPQFKQLAATGQLLPTDRVRKQGMVKTVVARRVKGLFAPPAGQEIADAP